MPSTLQLRGREWWRMGTQSAPKLRGAQIAADIHKKNVFIEGIETDSGISSQPIGFEEAYKGWLNRCEQALTRDTKGKRPRLAGTAENFLLKIGNYYYDFPVLGAIFPQKNTQYTAYPTYGMTFRMPTKMAEWVLRDCNKRELGKAIQELAKAQNLEGIEKDTMKWFSQGRIDEAARDRIVGIGLASSFAPAFHPERFDLRQFANNKFDLNRALSDTMQEPVTIPHNYNGKIFVLGSASRHKWDAVSGGLKKLNQNALVVFTDVAFSKDKKQPIGEKANYNELISLTKQRVKEAREYAKKKNIPADYFVGIQEGIIEILGEWHKLSCIIIQDQNGFETMEFTNSFWIPKNFVTMMVELNTELGHLIQMFDPMAIKDPERFFLPGVDQLYRKENIQRTFINACIEHLWPQPYIEANAYFDKVV